MQKVVIRIQQGHLKPYRCCYFVSSFSTQLAILYLRLVGAIFSPVGADDDDCNSVTIPSPPTTRLKNVESNQQMHSFYAQSLAKVL